MSYSSKPSSSSQPLRKRAPMACVRCRRRRIKCIAINGPDQPCERCAVRNHPCEYISVAEECERVSSSSPKTTLRHGPIATPTLPVSYMPNSSTSNSSTLISWHQQHGTAHQPVTQQHASVASAFNVAPTLPSNDYRIVRDVSDSQPQHPRRNLVQQQLSSGYEYPDIGWTAAGLHGQSHGRPMGPHPEQLYPQHLPTSSDNSALYFHSHDPNLVDNTYNIRMETDPYFQSRVCTCYPAGPCYCGLRREY